MRTFKQPLPDGTQIERKEDGRGRTYVVRLPSGAESKCMSVTSALNVVGKPWLGAWMAKRMREAARAYAAERYGSVVPAELEEHLRVVARSKVEAERGTRIHEAIERLAQPGADVEAVLASLTDEVQPAARGFLRWLSETGSEVVAAEVVVMHPLMNYAGTVDAFVMRDGKLLAADWKSSKALYEDYAWQLAAYDRAYAALTGEPLDGAIAVRFDPATGEYEEKAVNVDDAWLVFAHALALNERKAMDPWKSTPDC